MSEHEDIARRLRQEGQASAPPDLLPQVMAEVRATPKRRRRRLPSVPHWQPALRWAVAACVLVAIGFGIAQLPHSGGSSSSGSFSSAPERQGASAGATKASRVPATAAETRTYTVSRQDATKILSSLRAYQPFQNRHIPARLKLAVPTSVFGPISRRLAAAEKRYAAPPQPNGLSDTVIIKLMRLHGR